MRTEKSGQGQRLPLDQLRWQLQERGGKDLLLSCLVDTF